MPDGSLNIFLCYRREDTAGYALGFRRLIRDALPHAEIFLDVESIDSGMRWREEIRNRIAQCDVLLLVIGDEWLVRRDGVKKIDDENDPVRFEIGEALRRDNPPWLIPVLVEDARMPRASDLPPEVQPLCDYHAHRIHDQSYDRDLKDLIETLDRMTDSRPAIDPGDGAPPGGDQFPRLTEAYLAQHVPAMGRERLRELIDVAHARGWSDEDIFDYALSYSPLQPPKRLPSRITPTWLAENVPLMHPKRVAALVGELKKRGWSDDEIQRYVLANHPRAGITEIPSKVYPAWLERNAALMTAEFQRKLGATLLERGWTPREIRRYLRHGV